MNINELVEMFHESVSNYLKTEDSDDLYYMGRAHAYTLVFNVLYKHRLIDGDTLSQLQREWEEAFDEKTGIADKHFSSRQQVVRLSEKEKHNEEI